MQKHIIDTNILIYDIMSNYYENSEIKRKIQEYRDLPVNNRVITDFILCEFEILLTRTIPRKYKFDKKIINNLKRQTKELLLIFTREYFVITPIKSELFYANELYSKYQKRKLSYCDCLILSIGCSRGYKVMTLDRSMADIQRMR